MKEHLERAYKKNTKPINIMNLTLSTVYLSGFLLINLTLIFCCALFELSVSVILTIYSKVELIFF